MGMRIATGLKALAMTEEICGPPPLHCHSEHGAPRSESEINMLAGGKHTAIQRRRVEESVTLLGNPAGGSRASPTRREFWENGEIGALRLLRMTEAIYNYRKFLLDFPGEQR